MSTASGYRTKQRELILDYIIENKNRHIMADDVIESLKSQGNAVGKSTVYRYLDKLVDQGLVRRYFLEEGMGACYQYSGECPTCAHYHLKCLDCGKLYHVQCEYLDEISSHIGSHHNFSIDNSKTVFYGICENCTNEKERNGNEQIY